MSKRNRSEGWIHAKRSGHANEQYVEELISQDSTFQLEFLKRLGKEGVLITNYNIGGLYEKNVECILGGCTKSKTDLKVSLSDGSSFNISIKKSLNGQVYLIGVDRFIEGFERQYTTEIPEHIKEAISLFWGTSDNILAIVEKYGANKEYEKRKHRLVAETLKLYNQTLYSEMLEWFKTNIDLIFDFCFSKGLARDSSEWADIIWYINGFGENDVDEMFLISELKEIFSQKENTSVEYGTRGGGTTIQLPFGFVQWHCPSKVIPGEMQFHHNYNKIKSAINYKDKEKA